MSTTPSPSTPAINATVMASAGTGKTYTLVNRLLRLLLAGARPDAILAITFTRKAAAEMQSRLSERLLALAAADETELTNQLKALCGTTPEPALIMQARNLFEALRQGRHSVRTTTFHAFCQDILLRFPLEADVPPGFTLLDNSAELLHAARDSLLSEVSAQPDGELAGALQQLLDYCGGLDGLERALTTFIAHRGDWWAYTEGQAEPITFALERLGAQLEINSYEDPLQEFFSLRRMEELAEFAALLAKHPGIKNDAALTELAAARDTAQEPVVRFTACRKSFLTQKDTPLARKASQAQAKKMGPDGEERFLELHEQISQALLATLDQCLAHAAWHAGEAWYRAGSRLLEHYQQLKREQRVLDFTDLEWSAYRLLNHADNAQWVQYKLDQRIEHLLVDEFQDTNPTQWRLLLPLLEEMAAGGSDKARSVFLVGDAKQSIYRFRRAEPRLFQAAHEWLAERVNARAFPLHTSWRSAPAIMQCVNQVFGEGGPLAGELRDFAPHDTNHTGLWGEVRVLPLIDLLPTEEDEHASQELRNPLQQPREIQLSDPYLDEGRQIVAEIRRLFDSGIIIGEKEKARPLRYGDIMILLRRRSHSGAYEQALRNAGIPYIGAERGTLLQSVEVSDMVALLEVLITPYNNLSLATVLRSPLFACDDRDLIRLAESGSGGWYQRLQLLAPSLETASPLSTAANLLQRWHTLAGRVPIHDLLDRIFCEGNVLERYQAAFPRHLASRVVANLTRFLELALEIDSGRYPSLGHFLSRLGEMEESGDEAPDQAPASGDTNRVRMLTIHAAKGLEAPVVFLADSAQSKPPARPYRTLLEWPPEAARPGSFTLSGKQAQQPAAVRRLLEREQAEEQREAANLLYVALTRARQLLFISGVKPSKGDESGWYFALRQALDPEGVVEAEQPSLLSSGEMAKIDVAVAQKEEPAPVSVDPRLAQPIVCIAPLHEIAPSYQFTQGHIPVAQGDEDGRLRGIIIHRLLQEMSEQETTDWEQLSGQISAEFALEKEDKLFQQCYAECVGLLQEEKLKMLFTETEGIEALSEVPLLYGLGDQTVYGVIDRLLISEKEIQIIDYKSHRHAAAENLPVLSEVYRPQLTYYAKGVQQLWPGRNVRCFLLFTSPRLLHEVALNSD